MLLFLYGTLMTGEPGHRELRLAKRLVLIGRDRIAGTLYDLGDYPGLILSGSGIVQGELFAAPDSGLLGEIDAFELYDPFDREASEYLRIRVTTLDSGHDAWTYAYNCGVRGMPVIASGNWHIR